MHVVVATVALLWAGMILGISFLDSWAKFRAPSLTRAVALDVGRTIFHYFHKAQNVLIIFIITVCLLFLRSLSGWIMLGILNVILFSQLFWLLPQLNYQVEAIINGDKPKHSCAHLYFGVAEVAKFSTLIIFSITLLF